MEFTLDNGLRVVHMYDGDTATVVLTVLYDTGARDEDPGQTGMAHLFEHLMFGGSANVPDFDRTLDAAGGSNNAFTGSDFTVFYDVVPAVNAETAFYAESDRMLALAFSDRALEVQRSVVIEEFKETCLNRPYGGVSHALRPLLYPSHPYRWPVIGICPEHIAAVEQDDVRRWFYAHYAPNNAVLSIVGNITEERARALAEKYFGTIPARDIAPRRLVDDPWPTEEKCVTIHDNVPQTLIAMAFRMDPYGTRGYYAADAITDILSAGRSSRLFQRLVMGSGLFTAADASISGSEHSGYLILTGRVTSEADADIDRARAMLLEQAQMLAGADPVTDYELERTKNRFEATTRYENMNLTALGANLAKAVYHGETLDTPIAAYRSLTAADIAAEARRIFIDHAPATVLCRPI